MSKKNTSKGNQKESAKTKDNDFLSKIINFPVASSIIAIVILIIYIQTFTFEMGKLDEDHLIINNMSLLTDLSNFKTAISTDAFFGVKSSNFYRPLQNLSYMIDAQIGGGSPWAFYLTNILLHFFTCITLLFLFKKLKLNEKISFALILFFAVSPLFSHSVAWLPARGDLILGLFGALSLLFLIEYLDSKRWLYVGLHILTFGVALFSKETAILFPIAFAGFVILTQKKKFPTQFIASIFGYGLLILIFMSYRSQIASTNETGLVFNIGGLFANLQVFPEFISKFIIPYNLSPMPAYDMLVTLIGLAGIAIFGWLAFKQETTAKKYILFGVLWFLLFIVPGAMYVHAYKSASYSYLEHRSYLPLIGILLGLGYILSAKSMIFKRNQIIYGIFGISAIYIIISIISIRDYKDPLSYYNYAVRTNPNSAMAYYNRAIKLKDQKRTEEALADYNKAIEIKPDYAEPLVNRGAYRKEKGDLDGALKDFEDGLKYNPRLPEAHYNVALIQNTKGKLKEALLHCQNAVALKPDLAEAYMLMGNIYFGMQDYKSAISNYDYNLQLKPTDAGVYNNRGSARFLTNMPKEAISDFTRAIELNPAYADAYKNRGTTKSNTGDKKGACADWQKAAELGSKESEIMLNQFCR